MKQRKKLQAMPQAKLLRNKELVVFDLDGTLAESKAPMDGDMVRLFTELLRKRRVAVIGGGKYELFKEQLVRPLSRANVGGELLSRLYLFPTTSTRFYRYVSASAAGARGAARAGIGGARGGKNGRRKKSGWVNVYTLSLRAADRAAIKKAFRDAFREANYKNPNKTYGKIVEDRGTQVTFSVFGQDIVKALGEKGVKIKDDWRKKNTPLKLMLAKMVQKRLPWLEVHAAGQTSIDVTRKGIDKAYGVRQIEKILHVQVGKMVFIGDALFPGGNDYAARKTGVDCIPVKNPKGTQAVIKKILESAR